MTEEEADTTTEIVLPEKGVLAALWDSHPSLRQRLIDEKHNCLTRWPSQQTICVASCKSMGMNALLLECLAKAWTQVNAYPRAVPVEYIREEAGKSHVAHKSPLRPGTFFFAERTENSRLKRV